MVWSPSLRLMMRGKACLISQFCCSWKMLEHWKRTYNKVSEVWSPSLRLMMRGKACLISQFCCSWKMLSTIHKKSASFVTKTEHNVILLKIKNYQICTVMLLFVLYIFCQIFFYTSYKKTANIEGEKIGTKCVRKLGLFPLSSLIVVLSSMISPRQAKYSAWKKRWHVVFYSIIIINVNK